MNKNNNGDLPSFDKAYKAFHKPIFYFTRKLLENEMEAQDITADTFFKLWQRWNNFDNIQNVKAFLYITSRNACLDFLKKNKRESSAKVELSYIILPFEEAEVQVGISMDVLQEIKNEIENLPEKSREIFELRILEGLSYKQISEKLGINDNSAMKAHSKALNRLRDIFKDRDPLALIILYFIIGNND